MLFGSAEGSPDRACQQSDGELTGRQATRYWTSAFGRGLQRDFPKRGFILGDVLLKHVEQRLGLLRAEVDALEIVDGHVVGPV